MRAITIVTFSVSTLLFGCEKEIIQDSVLNASNPGNGLVTFRDQTLKGFNKIDHPYFQALDQHRFSFWVGAKYGVDGLYPTNCTYSGSFLDRGINQNVGPIHIGDYIVEPDLNNSNGHASYQPTDLVTEPTITEIWGSDVRFRFEKGELLKEFIGTLRYPEIMILEDPSYIQEVKQISRSHA